MRIRFFSSEVSPPLSCMQLPECLGIQLRTVQSPNSAPLSAMLLAKRKLPVAFEKSKRSRSKLDGRRNPRSELGADGGIVEPLLVLPSELGMFQGTCICMACSEDQASDSVKVADASNEEEDPSSPCTQPCHLRCFRLYTVSHNYRTGRESVLVGKDAGDFSGRPSELGRDRHSSVVGSGAGSANSAASNQFQFCDLKSTSAAKPG